VANYALLTNMTNKKYKTKLLQRWLAMCSVQWNDL